MKSFNWIFILCMAVGFYEYSHAQIAGFKNFEIVESAPVETSLDWATFGALPEMFQTVWGALNTSLEIKKGEVLLIRGGTSSLGMTAARIAKKMGAR